MSEAALVPTIDLREHYPAEAEERGQHTNWTSTPIGKAVASATLFAELTPLNEAMRLPLAVAAYKAGGPELAGLVAGVSTFAIESAGGVVAADALDTPSGQNMIERVKARAKKLKIDMDKLPETTPPVEAGVAIFGGSAVVTAVKHFQDPERTRSQNRRYARNSAAGLGVLIGSTGYLAAEGVSHPSPIAVGAATLAAGVAYSAFKWTRDRVRGDEELGAEEPKKVPGRHRRVKQPPFSRLFRNEDQMSEQAYGEIYHEYVQGTTTGPQIEGLSPDEFVEASRDSRTVSLEVTKKDKERSVDVPFLVPIEHASWLNSKFLRERGYDPGETVYCALPQALLSEEDPEKIREAITNTKEKRKSLNIVIDYPEGSQNFLAEIDPTLETDDLITSNETPAAIYHYKSVVTPDMKAVQEYQPDSQVQQIEQQDVNKYFDRIWDIYEKQFKGLVDAHPIAGALSKGELLETLQSSGCRLSAYFDEGGTIQAFGYVVDDTDLCPWLNKEHFNSMRTESGGLPVVYMPGIATAPEAKSPLGTKVMNHLSKQTAQMHGGPFVLTFECSNLSARYIPMLTRRAFDQSAMCDLSPFEETKHYYKVVS